MVSFFRNSEGAEPRPAGCVKWDASDESGLGNHLSPFAALAHNRGQRNLRHRQKQKPAIPDNRKRILVCRYFLRHGRMPSHARNPEIHG